MTLILISIQIIQVTFGKEKKDVCVYGERETIRQNRIKRW